MIAQPASGPTTSVADPTSAYQHFARLLMESSSGESGVKDAEEIWTLLHKIIMECSRAHVEAGKTWICKHCTQPTQLEALVELMIALVRSTKVFEDKLHIIYLVNDLLAYGDRKSVTWIKDALYPKLVPLLRLAYHCPGCDQSHQNKVLKVIGIWKEKEYFGLPIINVIQNAVVLSINTAEAPKTTSMVAPEVAAPPAIEAAGEGRDRNSDVSKPMPNTTISPHTVNQRRPPEMPKKSYFDLPAGPMLSLAKLEYTPYSPIQATQLAITQRQPPTQELLKVIDSYYRDLATINEEQFDTEGWESGYLDNYFEDMEKRKTKAAEIQAQRKLVEESRLSRQNQDTQTDSADSNHRPSSRHRGKSSRSRSRSRSRERQNSPSRSRYRRRRSRSYSNSRSRSRSPSPARSRRQRSRSPPNRHHRSSPAQASRGLGFSTSSSDTRLSHAGIGAQPSFHAKEWDTAPRAGLGSSAGPSSVDFTPASAASALPATSDAFDAYRRNRSYNYNRESSRRNDLPTCFKCYKPGHLAKDCTSHMTS